MSDNVNNNKKKYQTRSSKNKVFVELGSNRKVVKRKINNTNNEEINKNKRNKIEDDDDFIVDDIEYVSSDESWLEDEETTSSDGYDLTDSETDEESDESSIEEDNIKVEVIRNKYNDEDEESEYEPGDDLEDFKLDDKLKKIIAEKLKTQIYENVIKRALEEEKIFEDAYFEENEEDDTYDEEEDEDYEEKTKIMKENEKYFEKLPEEKKEKYKKIEEDIKNMYKNITPLRYKILDLDTTLTNKANILQKVETFEKMGSDNSEYNKLGQWMNKMKLIPFGKYKKINVNKSDGFEKINLFLNKAYKSLDNRLYGQYEAKNKLIQIMTQWITNPKSQTTVLALEGPPGVGKTSLIKHGLSNALDLPFNFIALGGANDVSSYVGSSYVYEGASNGEITNMLIKSQCMNPIIFMDELDKVSFSERGKEIIGMLTHLTDTTQNSSFVDKYFDGIELDLSRAFFVFSFNNINLIDPILRDRLNIIRFKPYKSNDKKIIVKKYILPELLKNIGMNEGDILISDDNVKYVITNFTGNEKGVRNLKRCLEDIIMKLNLIRFVNKGKNDIVFPYEIKNINTDLPIKLNNVIISNLLKSNFNKAIPDFVKNMYS
jgi:ATP-dependent Lon protease